MIVRDLVGGGGRVKLLLPSDWDWVVETDEVIDFLGAMAGGPKLNLMSVAGSGQSSLPRISVDAAGVGGSVVRGMAACLEI